jgi:phenylpyruvate tautomerase
MPLLRLETSASIPDEKRYALLASLSGIVSETIGKPEQYVMVCINPAAIRMSGESGPAAFVDVRSIGGLSREVNRKLSEKVCSILHEDLGVPPERTYLNFVDTAAANWGWSGSTFG